MTTSNYALRLQASLKAAAEGTTLNQFINVAVVEKIAALMTLDNLRDWARRGSASGALAMLEGAGSDGPVAKGDKVIKKGQKKKILILISPRSLRSTSHRRCINS
jgi:hypothetical protein